MRIAVGSTNPVKCRAAEGVLSPLYSAVTFSAFEVESGVRAQPWGDLETRQGAINRARAALSAGDADLGVGFEGGVVENEIGLFVCSWAAIVDGTGYLGVGGNCGLQLPDSVAAALRAGGELGPAMDALVGAHNTRQREGAVGILTGGLVDRQAAFEFILRLALAPFRNRQWYGGMHPLSGGQKWQQL